ncbi:MAG: energy transducer TonB [Bacteroidota bacterium]
MKIVVCCLFCFGIFSGLLAQEDNSKKKITWESSSETPPQFPGCEFLMNNQSLWQCQQEKIVQFLKEHYEYPSPALVCSVEGTTVASFTIAKEDGSIKDIKIIRSLHPSYDESLVNAIKKMPKWKPGTLNGKNVDINYVLPFKTSLE